MVNFIRRMTILKTVMNGNHTLIAYIQIIDRNALEIDILRFILISIMFYFQSSKMEPNVFRCSGICAKNQKKFNQFFYQLRIIYLPYISAAFLFVGISTGWSITGSNRFVPVLNPGYSSGLLILRDERRKKKVMQSCLNNAQATKVFLKSLLLISHE